MLASTNNPDLAVFVERREAAVAELDAAIAELAPAREAVKVAAEAALQAGRRFNRIVSRIIQAQRDERDGTAPVLMRVIEDERRARDAVDAAHTRAKQELANAEWRVSCLRADIEQLDRVINPPPMGGRLVEIVKREPQGPATVETITFPPGYPAAGQAA